MKIVNLIQGTPEWHAHRAQHFNASDAPAMMGCSQYKTRSQIIKELATGIVDAEIDSATARRFADGHRAEALARPLAEKIIGEELYPVTGTNGRFSASFDGLTLMYDVAFEHKLVNERLRLAFAEMADDDTAGHLLPMDYRAQMEHQMMVSECDRVLFMATRWDADGNLQECMHVWYESDPELRKQINAGWDQFAADLAAYTPQATEAKPVGRTPENLPALRIEVTGAVTASNLAEYKAHALEVFKGINRNLSTDQDFADAEKVVKWCGDVETRLAAAKEHALSQTASIDELFKAIDDISAEAKRTRLELDRLVKARKEQIREEIVSEGRAAFAQHVASLNERLGNRLMPPLFPDFATAIKNKRTVDSLRDAVNTTLAKAKIEANTIADGIQINLRTIAEAGSPHLFPDEALLLLKPADDLAAIISSRKADEQRRIDSANQARAEQDRKAAEQAPAPAPATVHQISDEQPKPARSNEPATLKLGEICARLGITLTAGVIEDVLGIAPAKVEKASKLYRPSDFARICDALIAHIQKAKAGELQAA